MQNDSRSIGQLQGVWSNMFKLLMILLPVWITADAGIKWKLVKDYFSLRERIKVVEIKVSIAHPQMDIPIKDGDKS